MAVLGYSLIVSIMRSFHVRDEAARVMVAAPLLAFITTHILYLNNYKMDYGKTVNSKFYSFYKLNVVQLKKCMQYIVDGCSEKFRVKA